MKKILNPFKMIRDDIKCPSEKELLEAKQLICSVLSDCRYQIKKFLKANNLPNYGEFIAVSSDAIFDNLMAICRIGSGYNSQIFTLSRNYQEIIVDNFWLFDFYVNNQKIAEDISERFFFFGKKMLIEQIDTNLKIMDEDLFFRDMKKTELKQKRDMLQKEIETYTFWGKNKFQQNDWRAHPLHFKKHDEVKWKTITKIASERAENSVNFKNAPFEYNLNLLSSFNHWDPLQIDNKNSNDILFNRTLNILLGFAFDILNIQYKIRGINTQRPKEFVKAIHLAYYSSK